MRNDEFDGVVFAGGGTRCFWQLGLWSVCAPELGLAPRVVAAVSAGSAMACAALLGRCEETLELFRRAVASNPRNAYPERLLGPERVFPHAAMYRRTIHEVIDAERLRRLQALADLKVVVGRPPSALGARTGLLLGLGCYLISRRSGDPVHPELARRAGFSAEAFSIRSCRTVDELADLLLASSCTPPFTPVLAYRGRPAIDGSVVDNAPLFALEGQARRTLVLLTRSYRSPPPARRDLVYLGPSEPIPIRKWDYTSPELLERTFELGRRDGARFLETHRFSS